MGRLAEIEKRLAEIKGILEKGDGSIDELETESKALLEERVALLDQAEKRKTMLDGIANMRTANIIPHGIKSEEVGEIEKRAEQLTKTGRMTIPAAETRSVLLDTGTLAKPTSVDGITEPFNIVSSIVDMVYVDDLTGVGYHREAYMESWQEAKENTSYGSAPTTSDPVFRQVAIDPFPLDVMTYVGKNLRKQTPLQYEEKVRRGALIALRKKVANWIISGDGATKAFGIYNAVNTELSPGSMTDTLLVAKDGSIAPNTLRNIVFAYGGDENVIGAGARLFLNKKDLIAFGDVRGTQEKKAIYEIVPDGSNPNIGVIKEGGLTVPYVICSDVTAWTGSATTGAERIKTMIYGDPYAYKLGLFGDYEVNVDDSYKFGEGLLTVKGEVMVGGNVTMHKGFVVVTKKATADN